MTSGSHARVRRFKSSLGLPNSGLADCYINMWHCDGLSGSSATERPLGTVCKEKGISSQFRVSISS